MTSNQLIRQLEHATCELVAAADADLDRVQKLLECRAAVLARIAEYDPSAFTQRELASLRAAARNGEAALEKLTLLRQRTAGDLHRFSHMRTGTSEPAESTLSISG